MTVVVSGDTALFQGLTEHMTKELTPLTRDLTEDLMRILTQQEYSLSATAEREIVRVVKETVLHAFRLRHRAQTDRGV